MSVSTKIETSYSIIEIKDDIVYTTIKEGAELGIEEIKEGIKIRNELQEGQPMLTLTDIRNVYSITNEAREFAAKSKENAALIIATAILTDSLSTKMMANFFIRFSKPITPYKAFKNKEKAIEWLRSFKKD
ncbi:MAG: STAS/SEC14 domain-containing protein [Flavobacteriales bacterium]|nr:STAS/SEC14 domain-containing protein [Flavobacteriales bacterium]